MVVKWKYTHSAIRPTQDVTAEERSAEIAAHMNEMASNGWELLTAGPMERMRIWSWQARGEYEQALPWARVEGQGLIDHHFYWRRPAKG